MNNMDFIGITKSILNFVIPWLTMSVAVWLSVKSFDKNFSFLYITGVTYSALILFEAVVLIFTSTGSFISNPVVSLLGIFVAFMVVLGVFRVSFKGGWLGTLGMALLAITITIVIEFLLEEVGLGPFTIAHSLQWIF